MANKRYLKTVFWFIGPSCSGKSHYSELLSQNLNLYCAHLDCAYITSPDILPNQTPDYKSLLNVDLDVFIIDGILPFIYNQDMITVKNLLGDARIVYVIVNPEYDQYLTNYMIRKTSAPSTTILTKEKYETEIFKYKTFAKKYIEINSEVDILDKITMEDIRSIRYQHFGHTDKKWQKLQINCENKTILDLGCNSCFYEIFANESGASKYTGLDVNKAYLFNDNAQYFDLNHLENWNKPYDIVVSSSMLHYIRDKELFIGHCARITKELFVLETPLSKSSDLIIECDPNRHYLYFPSKSMLEYWLSEYFTDFKCLGESVTEDNSYRLIYHCRK